MTYQHIYTLSSILFPLMPVNSGETNIELKLAVHKDIIWSIEKALSLSECAVEGVERGFIQDDD